MQAEPSNVSMVCNGSRVPLWCNIICTTMFRHFNARKTKQKKNMRTKCKERMVRIPIFQALPNVQRHPTINRGRTNVRHCEVQSPCHRNPTTHACQHNSGSSQAVGWYNKSTIKESPNGRVNRHWVTTRGSIRQEKRKTAKKQRANQKSNRKLWHQQRYLPNLQMVKMKIQQ